MAEPRIASVTRQTAETEVTVKINLDGSGKWEFSMDVPFLRHMLTHLALHSMIDLRVTARGDTEIDDHHTVEDIGIVLGQALRQALQGGEAIMRYGSIHIPMDEALLLVAVDISGRPYLGYDLELPAQRVGSFDTELVREFLRALVYHGGLTLHVRQLAGVNTHHIIEAVFKGLGRVLRAAVQRDPRRKGIPSTKGVL